MVSSSGTARGTTNWGADIVNDDGSGSGRRGFRRLSATHLRKSRNPCCSARGHGFLKPPPTRGCAGCCNLSGWNSIMSQPISELPRVRAPEFPAGLDWIHTGGGPLALAGLRGRVVLLDFWTYG